MGVDASGGFGPVAGLRYGALGFALAFVALPLYVTLPAHYAQQYGVPLAMLGAVLLYLLPFVLSPLIGHHHALVFGCVMVLVVLFQPKGLMGLWDAIRPSRATKKASTHG